MKRTLAAACAVLLALLALPSAASAGTPAGFFGISPQGATNPSDFELMAEAGVRSVRIPLYWSQVETASPFAAAPDWSRFDLDVELAARYGMEVLPVVWASPSWVTPEPRLEPSRGWQLRAWASFLRRAVQRYGLGGTLWSSDPDLPYMPIRRWEIWNEENIVTFGRADPQRFAGLVRVSGRVVHAGRRQSDPRRLLRPAAADPPQRQLRRLPLRALPRPPGEAVLRRRCTSPLRLRRRRDAGADSQPAPRNARSTTTPPRPLYVTELGWGSASFESRWERGPWGQARELDQAFSMLASHRRSWRIGGAWWFSWTDAAGSCQFCDSAGLLTENREAKPSWYVFNEWTGGDPEIVPRASLGVAPAAEVPVLEGE